MVSHALQYPTSEPEARNTHTATALPSLPPPPCHPAALLPAAVELPLLPLPPPRCLSRPCTANATAALPRCLPCSANDATALPLLTPPCCCAAAATTLTMLMPLPHCPQLPPRCLPSPCRCCAASVALPPPPCRPAPPLCCRRLLCNRKYFGSYLGYIPMIPTSPQCDTFQLIPVSFYDFLGHSTSSSTEELV